MKKITLKKEQIKTDIQKTFTKLRNELNNREDKLIEETDKLFENSFEKEVILKNCEKLPNKIKQTLEKCKTTYDNWNDEKKLKFLINDSINIENYIKEIKSINDIVKNSNENYSSIRFILGESEINFLLDKIKNFGIIRDDIFFLEPSNIISASTNINFIINQIKTNNNIESNKVCKLKLLYRTTKDGDDCKVYHQKTNNIPDTLTIIKTKEDITFGGYTKIKIPKCNGQDLRDDKAFIFSLDYNKLYFPKKNFCSKHSNEGYGPIFGIYGEHNYINYPILVRGKKFLTTKDNSTCTKDSTYNNFEFDYELNKGKKFFEIKDIEVYQVLFE